MSRAVGSASAMAATAVAAREGMADVLFDVSTVVTAIGEASRNGRTWLRLKNVSRLDLSDTKGWRRLLRRLDELDYRARLEWVMPLPGEDEELKHAELVIGWGVPGVGMEVPLALLRGKADN